MSKGPNQVELYRRQAQSALDKLEAFKKTKLPPLTVTLGTWMGETAEFWYGRWSKDQDRAQINADKYAVEANLHKQTKAALTIAQGMVAAKPTFKPGDHIKIIRTLDGGKWVGKFGTIVDMSSCFVRVALEGRTLLLLPDEVELCQNDSGWLAYNAVNDKFIELKRTQDVWEKRALEAERKLAEKATELIFGDRVQIVEAHNFPHLLRRFGVYQGKDHAGQVVVLVDYCEPPFHFRGKLKRDTADSSRPIKFSSVPVAESKIQLIKDIREATGWGLAASKLFAEGGNTEASKSVHGSLNNWFDTTYLPAALVKVATKYGVTIVNS